MQTCLARAPVAGRGLLQRSKLPDICARPHQQQALRRPGAAARGGSSSSSGDGASSSRHSSSTRLLSSRHSRRSAVTCRAADERQQQGGGGAGLAAKVNPVYLAIFGAYAALLLFRNPYIYAGLTIACILPQNSNVTSLNSLVLLFYESGLFVNFAEAVTCVRLVTWLSMGFMVFSFAIMA